MKEKVSIVICEYNEEATIEYVVRTCHEFNPGSEIVVVDDGSDDKTPEMLAGLKKEFDINLVTLEENQGKSHAMVVGVEHAEREVILFWDADLLNIRKEHFDQLIRPILSEDGEADMVLGSPSETLINYKVNPFKSLTGERAVYKKDLVPILENMRDIRFGVETYMNLYFQAHGKVVKYTLLDGLTHPTKYDKTSATKATSEFVSEGKEIAVTLLKNYDLITKRMGNSFEEQGESIKDSVKKLQKELNDKRQVLLGNNG